MSSIVERARQAKQRTEEKLARGGGSGAKFWRPEAGENKIRIMPPWSEDDFFKDQFWREVAQHWNVSADQKGPVLCPVHTPGMEGPCPICEFVEELKQDKTNIENKKLARELKAKTTYLLNVVVLNDPEYTAADVAEFKQNNPSRDCPFEPGQSKIYIYACPISIMDQIFGLIANNGQDITDLEKGRDLTIKKIPNKDRFKTRYEVYPAFESKEFETEGKLQLPELEQVGFKMEYEEMMNLLASGKGGSHALPSGSAGALSSGDDTPATDEVDLEAAMRNELSGK